MLESNSTRTTLVEPYIDRYGGRDGDADNYYCRYDIFLLAPHAGTGQTLGIQEGEGVVCFGVCSCFVLSHSGLLVLAQRDG